MISDYLEQFRDIIIDKNELQLILGENPLIARTKNPIPINATHIVNLLYAYKNKNIDIPYLIEWCDVVMFSDLFEYPDEENEQETIKSIVSEIAEQDMLDIFPDSKLTDERIDNWLRELKKFI